MNSTGLPAVHICLLLKTSSSREKRGIVILKEKPTEALGQTLPALRVSHSIFIKEKHSKFFFCPFA